MEELKKYIEEEIKSHRELLGGMPHGNSKLEYGVRTLNDILSKISDLENGKQL